MWNTRSSALPIQQSACQWRRGGSEAGRMPSSRPSRADGLSEPVAAAGHSDAGTFFRTGRLAGSFFFDRTRGRGVGCTLAEEEPPKRALRLLQPVVRSGEDVPQAGSRAQLDAMVARAAAHSIEVSALGDAAGTSAVLALDDADTVGKGVARLLGLCRTRRLLRRMAGTPARSIRPRTRTGRRASLGAVHLVTPFRFLGSLSGGSSVRRWARRRFRSRSTRGGGSPLPVVVGARFRHGQHLIGFQDLAGLFRRPFLLGRVVVRMVALEEEPLGALDHLGAGLGVHL